MGSRTAALLLDRDSLETVKKLLKQFVRFMVSMAHLAEAKVLRR
jgi:hypothetical protein